MPKFLKPGKVVIVLSGRYAGKKAVIVQNFDDGTKERPYGHCVVVGIEKTPLKVTKTMGAKRIAKRSKIKPFLKIVNYNHMMPTRYVVEAEELKTMIQAGGPSVLQTNPSGRVEVRKELKKVLQERYSEGKYKWFYAKLRF